MTESVQLDELDQYLSSDESPEDCMMLSDLDGLLHGVICSPSPISSDVWMTAGLGAEPKELPDWVVNTLLIAIWRLPKGLLMIRWLKRKIGFLIKVKIVFTQRVSCHL